MDLTQTTVGTVASAAVALAYSNKDTFNLSFNKSKILVPWSKLDYPGDLDMFNGLENMGSDGSRYKEACKWFDGKSAKDKWKTIVACTIVLEKPSGVLFSGMTGPQKEKFRALENRIKEASNTMKNTLSAFSTIYENAGDQNKESSLDNAVMSIMAYVMETPWDGDGEFPGYYMVASYDKIGIPKAFYDLVVQKLKERPKQAGWGSHFSNIDFDELSEIKLMSDGVHLNPNVAKYLPTLTKSEIRNRAPDQKAEMEKVRGNWHPEFKNINVSRSKVVAMLALTYQNHYFEIQSDWVEKYGGRPFKAKCPESTNAKTTEIWNTNMKKFIEEKKLYKKEAKKVFGSTWYKDLEREEHSISDENGIDSESGSVGSNGDDDDNSDDDDDETEGVDKILKMKADLRRKKMEDWKDKSEVIRAETDKGGVDYKFIEEMTSSMAEAAERKKNFSIEESIANYNDRKIETENI